MTSAWQEPKSAANEETQPLYPYSSETYTESGHSFQMDDTPERERIRIQHRSGTFIEMHPDGGFVFKSIKGDGYEIINGGNKNLYIKGDYNITIDGNCNFYVKGDYNLKVDGNYTQSISGNIVKLSENDQMFNQDTTEGDKVISATKDIVLNTLSDFISSGDGGKVIINGNLQVNGSIRSSASMYCEGSITAMMDIYSTTGLKTVGSLSVGPPALSPSIPMGVYITSPIVEIIAPTQIVGVTSITGATSIAGATDITGVTTINGATNINGLLNVFGLITCPDAFFLSTLEFFSTHSH